MRIISGFTKSRYDTSLQHEGLDSGHVDVSQICANFAFVVFEYIAKEVGRNYRREVLFTTVVQITTPPIFFEMGESGIGTLDASSTPFIPIFVKVERIEMDVVQNV